MPSTSGSPTQNVTFAATALDLAGTPDDAFKTGDLACVAALMPAGTSDVHLGVRRYATPAALCPECASKSQESDLERLTRDPAAFWKALSGEQKIRLLEEAPRVLRPWVVTTDGREARRCNVEDYVIAHAFEARGRKLAYWRNRGEGLMGGDDYEGLAEAQAAADAALASAGWELA